MPDRARIGTRARTRGFAILIGIATAYACTGAPPAGAIPPAAAPLGRPTGTIGPSPIPTSAGPVLPYGSPLYFVLEDKIDSGKTPIGTVIKLHLERPLVVGGVELAPGGAPATLTIVSRKRANVGDEDGAVQVHIDALQLPGRPTQPLQLRLLHEYLSIEHTGGQLATRDTVDTIGDIFIPYHVLYHYLRPGHQFVLPPGAVIRAQTQVTIDATNPHTITFETPPPFESTYDEPHSELTPQPLFTPAPQRPRPLPKGKPTLPPTPTPTITPTPAPSDTPAAGSPNASGAPVASPAPSAAAATSAAPIATGSPAASPRPH